MNRERARDPRGNRLSAGPLLFLLVVAAAVQTAAIAIGRIAWTSDQAVVGLMGRHIASGREHPIFYYGSAYAGTLESHLMALVFRVVGSSVWAYRFTLMIFMGVLIGFVFAAARRMFDRPAAIAAAAYLAIPPYYFLYKGLTSDGAYTSLSALTSAILYGAVRMDESMDGEPGKATPWFAFTGVVAGLAWWVDPLVGGACVGVLAWFVIVRPALFRRVRELAAFVAGFVVGALPWLLGNVGKGWPSLHSPSIRWLTQSEAVKQFVRFWTDAVPVLFGARPFTGQPDILPAATPAAFLAYAIPTALAVLVVIRHRRRLRGAPASEGEARSARYLLLPLLTVLGMHVLVAWHPYSYVPEPRYLLPIYGPTGLLFGYAFSRAWNALPRLVPAAAAVVLAGFHLVGLARSPMADDFDLHATSTVGPLVRALEERGIRDLYVSYWLGYRIAFESREQIRTASFGTGTQRTERYPPYEAAVASSESPGVVVRRDEAAAFDEYLASAGRRADRLEIGPYVVFWNFDPATLSEIRAVRQIPERARG